MKDGGSIISKPLCHIVNLSIGSGKFPLNWKAAKVTPIFKSGSRSLPENYRPISVLPIVSKLLEKAAQQALKDYFENENLLSKSQHGFRKKHSMKTASIYICDSIRKEMNNGKLTVAVYVDLSKAFDTIGHSVLLQKLSSYGMKDKEIEWLNSYLFNRKNYVWVDKTISSPEPVYCGIPPRIDLGTIIVYHFYQRSERLHRACISYYVC